MAIVRVAIFALVLLAGVYVVAGTITVSPNAIWPIIGGNIQRTGVASNTAVDLTQLNQTQLQWGKSASEGSEWEPFAVVDENGIIYVVEGKQPTPYDYQLVTLDPSNRGKIIWRSTLHQTYYNPGFTGVPTLASDGSVFVTLPIESLYKIDATDGTQLWNITSRHELTTVSPVLVEGNIYGFTFNYGSRVNLQQFSAEDGSQSVAPPAVEGGLDCQLTGDESGIFIQATGPMLQAYNVFTGDYLGTYTEIFALFEYMSLDCTSSSSSCIAVGPANFVRSDFSRQIIAVVFGKEPHAGGFTNPFNGGVDFLWSYEINKQPNDGVLGDRVAIYNGRVIATGYDHMASLDLTNGAEYWKVEVPNPNPTNLTDYVSPPTLDSAGTIFVLAGDSVTEHASVYAFDQDGIQLWESESFSCTTLGVGGGIVLGGDNAIIAVCHANIWYFSPPSSSDSRDYGRPQPLHQE